MRLADQQLMEREIQAIPTLLDQLADSLIGQQPIQASRVLVVGYGSNLHAARVLEKVLAQRGVGLRFASPEHAVLFEDELLVALTRSAANDDVMRYLRKNMDQRPCLLLTANAEQENVQQLTADHPNVRVASLGLGTARPSVATQSIFAIIMALDCVMAADITQRLELWREFSRMLRSEMASMSDRARGRAAVCHLAERVFVLGDGVMEEVGDSIALTMMEVSHTIALVIPLGAGTRGPMAHLGEHDVALLLGTGPEELFQQYRRLAGYSLQIKPPTHARDLAQALFTLIEGQLLALELSRLR